MRAVQAEYPSIGVDCVTVLDAERCKGLVGEGVAWVARYLGSVTPGELDVIFAAGLKFSPVTFADSVEGLVAVAQLTALGVPKGATVWLDIEGFGPGMDPTAVITEVDTWSDAVTGAGWQAGLYVGANALLTSEELYALRSVRYWKGASLLYDRLGRLAEPRCGWCLVQGVTTVLGGTEVDCDYVLPDYQGRLPVFVGP